MEELLNEMFSGSYENTEVKQPPRYPLTDVSVDDGVNEENTNLYIEVACAGFAKEDLLLEIVDDRIELSGTPKKELEGMFTYYQKHISRKPFVRIIKLDKNYVGGEVQAAYEDGLLLITIEKSKNSTPHRVKVEL